jgi:hypothetical protein
MFQPEGGRFAPPAQGRPVRTDGAGYALPPAMQQNASFNALARYVGGEPTGQARPARATTSYQVAACQSFCPASSRSRPASPRTR